MITNFIKDNKSNIFNREIDLTFLNDHLTCNNIKVLCINYELRLKSVILYEMDNHYYTDMLKIKNNKIIISVQKLKTKLNMFVDNVNNKYIDICLENLVIEINLKDFEIDTDLKNGVNISFEICGFEADLSNYFNNYFINTFSTKFEFTRSIIKMIISDYIKNNLHSFNIELDLSVKLFENLHSKFIIHKVYFYEKTNSCLIYYSINFRTIKKSIFRY